MKLTTTIVLLFAATTVAFGQVQAVSSTGSVTLQGQPSGATFVATGNKMEGNFQVFARGSAASTTVAPTVTLLVPAGIAPANTTATILKVSGMTAGNNRLVQSLHIKRPTPISSEILGNEKTEVPVKTELQNGEIKIVPATPLQAGEYVLAFMADGKIQSKIWDFRVQ
jgi:hypothetical protein